MKKSIDSIESSDRIQVLDQLRGFTLLLIFLVNLPRLSGIPSGDSIFIDLRDTVLSNQLHDWVRLLFGDSARPLFSFMFGISMVLIYDNVKKRGKNPFFTLTRRMFTLMIIGYIHFVYIWNGDILLMYALDGIMLLLFVSMSAWPLFLFGLSAILLFMETNSGLTLSLQQYGETLTLDLASGVPMLIEHGIRDFLWLGTDESFNQNLMIGNILYQLNLAVPHLFFFIIGMLAYRLNLFTELPRRKMVSWIVTVILLSVGLYGKHSLVDLDVPMWVLGERNLINFCVSLGIAFAIILLGTTKRLSMLTRPFTAVGRMAFTNYLLQSLVFVSVFIKSGESIFQGHGLLAPLPYSVLLPIALLFFGLQMWGSAIWLRYFYYGPFEWLWRWGTHLKLPQMRRRNL